MRDRVSAVGRLTDDLRRFDTGTSCASAESTMLDLHVWRGTADDAYANPANNTPIHLPQGPVPLARHPKAPRSITP